MYTRKTLRTVAILVAVGALLVGIANPPDARAGYGYADSPSFSLNTTAVSGTGVGGLVRAHHLGTCYPNPFNPATWIAYDLARPEVVELAVYDLKGRLVRQLSDGKLVPVGPHKVLWDGRDGSGRSVATGIYFYRMQAGSYVATRRMTLLK